MTTPTEAFEAGLLALGISVRGDREPRDIRSARKVLATATRLDPHMADAWIARLVAGDRAPSTYEGLYRARQRIDAVLPRYGLTVGDLIGIDVTGTGPLRYESGMLISAPLRSADAATAAYVAALCAAKRFDDAAAACAQLSPENPLTAYSAAALYYQTERWPQVIEATQSLRDHRDVTVAAAARALAGHAQAMLGLYTAALATAAEPLPGGRTIADVVPAAAATVAFFEAMCHRALGDEDRAREQLRAALTADPEHGAAAEMLADPTLQLATVDAQTLASRTDPWDPSTAVDANARAREAQDDNRAALLAAAEAELERQIGLAPVKHDIRTLKAQVRMDRAREKRNLPTTSGSRHLIFTGPPGTGKTTIARVVADIYCGLGVLAGRNASGGNLVEVKGGDLQAGYLGQTAQKVNDVVDSALDGVLFIDEAYSLIQEGFSGGDAYGQQAVDTLLARMENDRHRLMVIIAGYEDKIDRFLASNDGLAGRFSTRIAFTSYTGPELTEIAALFADKDASTLTDEAREFLDRVTTWLTTTYLPAADGEPRRTLIDDDQLGNARFIRNVMDQAQREMALRLDEEFGDDYDDLDEATLTTLTLADVKQAVLAVVPKKYAGLGVPQ